MAADILPSSGLSHLTTQENLFGSAHENHDAGRSLTETCLRIPDLFSGIMSPEVRINPWYSNVKPQTEVWFKEYAGTSNRAR